MKDIIVGLGGEDARLVEVHTVDPIPGTVTAHHSTTSAGWWVECEVNLTSVSPVRQVILRFTLRALHRLTEEASRAAERTAANEPT